jgi:CheY-like chemotaxis protein
MTDTILIVDSSEASAIGIRTILADLGYHAHVVFSAAEALQTCQKRGPAVLLASHQLSDMDTRELLRILKQSRRELETIVVCPRQSLPAEARRLKPLVSGLLAIPIQPDEMGLLLWGAMERVQLRRQLQQEKRDIVRKIRRRYAKRIETERFLTVKQIVDKLSTFIGRIARDVEGGVRYFNEIPYFVSIHDRKGQVLAANRSYRVLLRGRAGDASCLIYEGRAGSSDGCPVGRSLRTGNAQESREVVRYRSGARVPVIVHTAPIYNNDGEVELVLEVAAGTPDVDQLRVELQSTQQRYQLLFDAVPCFVVGLDPDLCVTTANRLFTEEFGERTGAFFREVFLIDDEVFAESPIHKTLKEGKPLNGEVALTGPNGRHYNMLVWTSPMSTAAGKLMQVLVIRQHGGTITVDSALGRGSRFGILLPRKANAT